MAPDLEMRVFVRGLDRKRALRIAAATQIEGAVPMYGPSLLFGGRVPQLHSFAVHDLLADSADWNSETWDMDPERLPELARTLEILFAQIPEELAVEVAWIGVEATDESAVSRGEMLDIARHGKIGTRTRYRIRVP